MWIFTENFFTTTKLAVFRVCVQFGLLFKVMVKILWGVYGYVHRFGMSNVFGSWVTIFHRNYHTEIELYTCILIICANEVPYLSNLILGGVCLWPHWTVTFDLQLRGRNDLISFIGAIFRYSANFVVKYASTCPTGEPRECSQSSMTHKILNSGLGGPIELHEDIC